MSVKGEVTLRKRFRNIYKDMCKSSQRPYSLREIENEIQKNKSAKIWSKCLRKDNSFFFFFFCLFKNIPENNWKKKKKQCVGKFTLLFLHWKC